MKNKILSYLKSLNINFKLIENSDIFINNISMIKYSNEYDICYLDSNVPHLISDKRNITLICPHDFDEINSNINYIKTNKPKLVFYYISSLFGNNEEFILDENLSKKYNSYIGINCKISNSAIIHPNVTIRSGTQIGENVIIESGSVIGSTGLLWMWDGIKKVMLTLTGNTIIKDNVYICANVSVVRGACNESTVINEGVMIAPGSAIGHGSNIGKNTHIANNVTIGGTVIVGENCFLGSGSTIQPGLNFYKNSVLGSSAVLTKNTLSTGVYTGIPAVKIKEVTGNLRGLPKN